MIATSEKLSLRRLGVDDFHAFQAYRADPEVAKYQSWQPMDEEATHRFLNHMATMTPLLQPGQWTQIAVTTPKGETLLGDMGIHLSADQSEAEIGITLARAHWRQGFAKQAMGLAIDYVFRHTNVDRIICGADQRNAPSLCLIRSLGFSYTHSEPGMDGTAKDDMFELRRSKNFHH